VIALDFNHAFFIRASAAQVLLELLGEGFKFILAMGQPLHQGDGFAAPPFALSEDPRRLLSGGETGRGTDAVGLTAGDTPRTKFLINQFTGAHTTSIVWDMASVKDGVYRIRTPENIELTLRLAGVGERLLAHLVDAWLNFALFISLWLLLLVVGALVLARRGTDLMTGLGTTAVAVILVAAGLLNTAYYLYFEIRWQGQTPGKRWTQLRVLKDDGRPLDPQGAIVRNILRVLDQTVGLGLFLVLFHPLEKRLGDLAAGTVVIKESAGSFPGLGPTDDSPPESVNVRRLSPQEYLYLGEFLKRRAELTPTARFDVAQRLATRYLVLLELPQLPEGQDAEAFLVDLYSRWSG